MNYYSAICDHDQAQREEQGQILRDSLNVRSSYRRSVRLGKGRICQGCLRTEDDCNCLEF